MSMEKHVYVGPYLRVWMPTVKEKSYYRKCPQCKTDEGGNFCPNCGSATTYPIVDKKVNLDELLLEEGLDEEMFFTPEIDLPYLIVLPNRSIRQGGLVLFEDETGEYEMPKGQQGDDWMTLGSLLTKKNIRFESCQGVIGYWM